MRRFDPELFRAFLSLYWLRPENGALMYYQSQSWGDIPIPSRSLDLSTGDGTFVFLHCGGRFADSFDFFWNTAATAFSHDAFVDIYDTVQQDYRPPVTKQPGVNFTVGTDWKAALVEKARRLQFFEKVIEHDNNRLPLPFEDNYFKFVHSNAVYWTNNSKELIADLYRMLDRGGHAVLEFCTPRMLSTLERLKPLLTPRALSILDRKRSVEMKVLTADYDDWSKWVQEAGFTIEDLRVAWPNQYITDCWNVGLRPIAHLLIRMADRMPLEERQAVKKEWVDIMFELLAPLCEKPARFEMKDAPYVAFVLRKG